MSASKQSKPYDVVKNDWEHLTRIEIGIIYKVDGLAQSIMSHEADFLNGIITHLKEAGEEDAVFSAKQRNWIHKLSDKYLGK